MAPSEVRKSCEKTVIILMICILFGLQYSACLADHEEGRIIMFKEPIPDKAIVGHVIHSEQVPNEGSCRVMCYMEPNCVSINIGPLKGGKLKCELNNATQQPSALKNEPAHMYLAIENPCSSSPCLNNGTCQAGFTSKGYRCKCQKGFIGNYCGRTAKSCSTLKKLDPAAESGDYVIDPDGEGGLPPLHDVTCDMMGMDGIGVTVISHNSEDRTKVRGCEPSGCYKRDIQYTRASLHQLESLTEVSLHCEQYIKYECKSSVLHKNNKRFGWWMSRDSTEMTYWGGASPGSDKCACGMNNSCADSRYGCNCDKNDFAWREDSGLLTDKTKLPVTQLRFGDTGDDREEGYHTLGKLKCYGIV